jgi:diadenosine tetraphosphate (Ap4A) HIT family hydrolase
MSESTKSFFCSLPKDRVWLKTEHSIAFLDGYPVSESHALVIPKRHAPILHDLPANELNDVLALALLR